MFGSIGMPELMIILVIAVIFFGPGKLPELGSMLGKAIRSFKTAVDASQEPEKLEKPEPGKSEGVKK